MDLVRRLTCFETHCNQRAMLRSPEALVFLLLLSEVSNGLHNPLGSFVSVVHTSSSRLPSRQNDVQKINIPCEIVQHNKHNGNAWIINQQSGRPVNMQHFPPNTMRSPMKTSFYPRQHTPSVKNTFYPRQHTPSVKNTFYPRQHTPSMKNTFYHRQHTPSMNKPFYPRQHTPSMKNTFYPRQHTPYMYGVSGHGRKKRFIRKPMCRVSPKKLPDYFNTKTIDEMLEKSLKEISAYMGPADICVGIMIDLDMCLTHRQTRLLHGNENNKRFKRKALKKLSKRWPNGIIPFEIIAGSFKQKDILVINDAMLEWERLTCLKFKQSTESDTNRLVIQTGAGCFSNVGRIGGPQPLVLGTGICRTKKVVMHEMAHAIGMIHEHQRPDRDNFIRVHLHNVKSRFVNQFDTFRTDAIENYSVDYDYLSIMHYGKTFFANDGISTTIQTLDYTYQDIIGRTEELSFSDVKTVNAMYKCHDGCPYPRLSCTGDGYMNKHCVCVCPDGTTSCSQLGTAVASAPILASEQSSSSHSHSRLDSYPLHHDFARRLLLKINQLYPNTRYSLPGSQVAPFMSPMFDKTVRGSQTVNSGSQISPYMSPMFDKTVRGSQTVNSGSQISPYMSPMGSQTVNSGQPVTNAPSNMMSEMVRKILLQQSLVPYNYPRGGGHAVGK